MKTLKANILISTLIAGLFSVLLYLNPTSLQRFNTNFIDSFFNFRGSTKASSDIAIIDIDEKSLKELGQWPWSRDKIARIVKNLTDAKMGILGFDMVFAESDRTSPKKILKDLNITIKAKDYDEILADTLKTSPAILGFVFNFEKNFTNNLPPVQNAIFSETNKNEYNSYIPRAKGYTTNIPLLQQSAFSSGGFNMIPDSDGVVRYVPMVFSYDGGIYPSLTLEMIRAILGVQIVNINYDENGISNIKIGELTIPTDRYGRVFVNYVGGKKSYKYISAVDIYNNNFKKSDIEGKILLFGTSAAGLLDLRATPFSTTFPGVEIHANVLDNIINQNFISSPSYAFGENIVIIFILVWFLFFISNYLSPKVLVVFSVLFLFFIYYGYYYLMFDEKILLNFLYPFLAILFSIFYILFQKLFIESKQKELIKQKFAKKVSPAVVEELLKDEVDFSAKEKEVTIFFSDIRSFTTISENFESASKLLDYLNSYLSFMSDIILKHSGTIDKYIGDAIMAYWNAPVKQDSHADLCVSSALKQVEAIEELNKTLSPPIAIGIGIHTGVATVGEVGSQNRSDFTIIGDSVNLASRLEGLTKAYGAKIIISQNTKDKLTKSYQIRELDVVKVKGKDKSIAIYEVLGFGEFSEKDKILQKKYKNALTFYKNADFKKARELFSELYGIKQEFLYKMYMKRCEELQEKDIKNFNGVYRFDTK